MQHPLCRCSRTGPGGTDAPGAAERHYHHLAAPCQEKHNKQAGRRIAPAGSCWFTTAALQMPSMLQPAAKECTADRLSACMCMHLLAAMQRASAACGPQPAAHHSPRCQLLVAAQLEVLQGAAGGQPCAHPAIAQPATHLQVEGGQGGAGPQQGHQAAVC